MSYNYYCYGILIHSEIELPELTSWSGKRETKNQDTPSIYIKRGSVPEHLPYYDVIRLGERQITPTHFLSCKKGVGVFYVSNGQEIVFSPYTDDMSAIRSTLLGSIMAAALYQRGHYLLHASAITMHSKAFLFAAPAGTGKSTTAATLTAHGARLLCDDVSLLEQKNERLYVVPAYPILKLRDDSLALFSKSIKNQSGERLTTKPLSWIEQINDRECQKYKVIPSSIQDTFSHRRIPISAIYILNRGEQPAIHTLTGFDALAGLKSVAYRAGIMARSGQSQPTFDFSKEWAAKIPIKQLETGPDMKSHKTFTDLLLNDLKR